MFIIKMDRLSGRLSNNRRYAIYLIQENKNHLSREIIDS